MSQVHVYLTKSDVARRHIQGLILSGQARPGDRITTREVSEAIGMSETPIREAIKALASEGWLTVQPHVGAVVAGVDVDQIHEIYSIYGRIGSLAIELSAPAYDTARLARIDANIAAAETAVAAMDIERYAQLNLEFHSLLYDTPHSQWCMKIFMTMRAQTSMQRGFAAVPQRLAQSLAEHRQIRDALRAGDHARAAELLREHERVAGEALLGELSGRSLEAAIATAPNPSSPA